MGFVDKGGLQDYKDNFFLEVGWGRQWFSIKFSKKYYLKKILSRTPPPPLQKLIGERLASPLVRRKTPKITTSNCDTCPKVSPIDSCLKLTWFEHENLGSILDNTPIINTSPNFIVSHTVSKNYITMLRFFKNLFQQRPHVPKCRFWNGVW